MKLRRHHSAQCTNLNHFNQWGRTVFGVPGQLIKPWLRFASTLPGRCCKQAHLQTHKVLLGDDVCGVFQEIDLIMDVYTLTSHYVPSCRSWRSLYSFSFLIPADHRTITRGGKEWRGHYDPFIDHCLKHTGAKRRREMLQWRIHLSRSSLTFV